MGAPRRTRSTSVRTPVRRNPSFEASQRGRGPRFLLTMSRGPAIRLLTLLAALALLAGGGAASAEVDGPTLAVGVDDGEYPELDVALDLADRGAPARLVLYAPKGFDLYPDRPEG